MAQPHSKLRSATDSCARLVTMVTRFVFILATLGIVRGSLIESCNVTKAFVQGHNLRRLQLAKGTLPGQPAAARMAYLTWDDELAKKAANWASRNKYMHNPDSTIPSGKYRTGENIFIFKTTASSYQFDPEMAMKSWWDEHSAFTYSKINRDMFLRSHKKVGHYTQMAWADSQKLGCAVSQYYEGKWNCFLVVCNYGPSGNYIGQFPYQKGNPANNLTCGDAETNCTLKYGKRCRNWRN